MAKELWTTAIFFLAREKYKPYYGEIVSSNGRAVHRIKSRINVN